MHAGNVAEPRAVDGLDMRRKADDMREQPISEEDRAHVQKLLRKFTNRLKAVNQPNTEATEPKKTPEQELSELAKKPIEPTRTQSKPGEAIRAHMEAERGE